MSSLTLAEHLRGTVVQNNSAIVLGSRSATQTTEDVLKRQGQKVRWLELFHALPAEMHMNISAQMDMDPVSQICFALTNRYFYQIYHMVKDVFFSDGSRWYPVKSWPLDLRMQISDCTQFMYHGWYDWTHLELDTTIQWNPSLGELLQKESIWEGLWYCGGCAKYKPEDAFAISDYEKSIEQRGIEWKPTIEDYYECDFGNSCGRCRAKDILIYLEERDEWFDDQIVEEERTSQGLRKLDWVNLIGVGDPLRSKTTLKAYLEVVGGYETWDEVFANLGM